MQRQKEKDNLNQESNLPTDEGEFLEKLKEFSNICLENIRLGLGNTESENQQHVKLENKKQIIEHLLSHSPLQMETLTRYFSILTKSMQENQDLSFHSNGDDIYASGQLIELQNLQEKRRFYSRRSSASRENCLGRTYASNSQGLEGFWIFS